MSLRRVLITAGPTHEPLDAVRYLANRSSGQVGIALARAAAESGCATTLLLGPVAAAPDLPAVRLERFTTTGDLERLLAGHFPACDILIMAAAVADYRPKAPIAGKLARSSEGLTLELEPTPDLVAGCAARKRPDQRIIGFALEEPSVLERRAQQKLARKRLDALVANPLETVGAGDIAARVFLPTGEIVSPPAARMSKAAFAAWLIAWAGGL